LAPAIALVATALLSSAAASAQATAFDVVEIVVSGEVDARVNLAECEADQVLTLRWTLTGTPLSDQTVTVFSDSLSSCNSTTPLASLYTGSASGEAVSVSVSVQSELHGGVCAEEEKHDRYLCLELAGGGLTETQSKALAVSFDLKPPADPVVTGQGGDGIAYISWSYEGGAPSDLGGFQVARRAASSTAAPTLSSVLAASTYTHPVSGLSNDQEYEFWVQTKDAYGNWSAGSSSILVTPKASEDFWEHYRASGGSAQGCAQRGKGSFGALIMILFAIFIPLLRLRRLKLGFSLLTIALALPQLSLAQASTRVDSRKWTFEAEFGPYLPEVDAGLTSGTPYADVFGKGATLLGRFRIDRALYQGIGQLGIGVGLGFGQDVGKGVFADGSHSADTTVFNWVPFELGVAYRFDYAALHWKIPLVPSVRIGLVSDLWWVLDGGGKVATDSAGERAQGLRFGYEYSAGLALHLNPLDPSLAMDFRRSAGVDNSYLFVQVRRMEIDGFGSEGLRLSDTSWSMGLSLEF